MKRAADRIVVVVELDVVVGTTVVVVLEDVVVGATVVVVLDPQVVIVVGGVEPQAHAVVVSGTE
jgi:hypothetical protein